MNRTYITLILSLSIFPIAAMEREEKFENAPRDKKNRLVAQQKAAPPAAQAKNYTKVVRVTNMPGKYYVCDEGHLHSSFEIFRDQDSTTRSFMCRH